MGSPSFSRSSLLAELQGRAALDQRGARHCGRAALGVLWEPGSFPTATYQASAMRHLEYDLMDFTAIMRGLHSYLVYVINLFYR